MSTQLQEPRSETFQADFKKRIKRFVLDLIQFTESLPRDQTCRVIGQQLLRSGTSIGANYFEAKAASSRNDFTNFFTYSLKSANESVFWLETLIEAEKGEAAKARRLLTEASQLARIFASSILTLKGKR